MVARLLIALDAQNPQLCFSHCELFQLVGEKRAGNFGVSVSTSRHQDMLHEGAGIRGHHGFTYRVAIGWGTQAIAVRLACCFIGSD